MSKKKVLFSCISWDTDGEVNNDLPKEVEAELETSEDYNIDLHGADFLSDKFGYCVNSFTWEVVE